MEKKKWYYSTWFVILMLIMIPPVGIILMWTGARFPKPVRIGITLICLWMVASHWDSVWFANYFDTSK